MRLLVIGHTAHYVADNRVVGWGPTVKEINWLAQAFDAVIHLACLHLNPAPASTLPYETDRINFVGVPPAGGLALPEKLRALTVAPNYSAEIIRQIRKADVIQIRTPGILGMYALVLVSWFSRKPRWTKYAGNWRASSPMPFSFRFQRGWLKRGFSRGPITINGRWPGQPPFVFSFLNPSLTLEEIGKAQQDTVKKNLSTPIHLIYAGRIEAEKGALATIEIARNLATQISFRLDILGDGPDLGICQANVADFGLQNQVVFHGWVSHKTLQEYLRHAHFVILPSESEGWPKILSEGMAYGAVPVASDVSAIPQVLNQFQAGFAIPSTDIPGFAQAILKTSQDPNRWKAFSMAGIRSAPWFSYEKYLVELDEMLAGYYGFPVLNQPLVKSLQGKFLEAVR